MTLLRHYALCIYRRRLKEGTYIGIGIVGLSAAFATLTLGLQLVQHEFGMDSFHQLSDRTFRVVQVAASGSYGNQVLYKHQTPASLAPELGAAIPPVECWLRVAKSRLWISSIGGESIRTNALFTDTTFFRVFSFGTQIAPSALNDPNSVILSSQLMERVLGPEGVVGDQLLVINEGETARVRVVGIIATPPKRSSLQPDLVIPLHSSLSPYQPQSGPIDGDLDTFLLLRQDVSIDDVRLRLGRFRSPLIERVDKRWTLDLQPLEDMYLNPSVGGNGSTPWFSLMFLGCAVLILAIASANYAAFSIAMFGRRSEEVHVRRALGAHRGQVNRQLVMEVVLQVAVSVVAGFLVGAWLLPHFGWMIARDLGMVLSLEMWVQLAGAMALVIVIAGVYPAVICAGAHPTSSRLSGLRVGGQTWLGRILLGGQLAMATLALVSGMVITEQFRYMESIDLGYPADELAMLKLAGGDDISAAQWRQAIERLRSEVAGEGSVIGLSGCSAFMEGIAYEVAEHRSATDYGYAHVIEADLHFPGVLGLDVISGKMVDSRSGTLRQVLVNKSARDDPKVGWGVGYMLPELRGGVVVESVVSDFYYRPVDELLEPLVIILAQEVTPSLALVRSKPGQLMLALKDLETAWSSVLPNRPFDATVLSVAHRDSRQDLLRMANMALGVGIVCLTLGLLGVYGIACLAVTQRTHEIAVRKAIGATPWDILWLVTLDTLKPLVPGAVIGSALARILMGEFVAQFAVQMDLAIVWFAAGSGAVLVAAGISGAVQIVRLSRTSPAVGIRST